MLLLIVHADHGSSREFTPSGLTVMVHRSRYFRNRKPTHRTFVLVIEFPIFLDTSLFQSYTFALGSHWVAYAASRPLLLRCILRQERCHTC